jgi:hypothetical protein
MGTVHKERERMAYLIINIGKIPPNDRNSMNTHTIPLKMGVWLSYKRHEGEWALSIKLHNDSLMDMAPAIKKKATERLDVIRGRVLTHGATGPWTKAITREQLLTLNAVLVDTELLQQTHDYMSCLNLREPEEIERSSEDRMMRVDKRAVQDYILKLSKTT